MNSITIAVLMPGDMGHAVGRVLREHGHHVITCLEGRGPHTRNLANQAGMTDVGDLTGLVKQADLILSILPPASALDLAMAISAEMQETEQTPVYVDCNAISPETVKQVGKAITSAGAQFIDAGIIGMAPGIGAGPRFYVSGPDVTPMMEFDGLGFAVIEAGPTIGQASALKMTYAGLTKGSWTLHTAILLAAERLGVRDQLLGEFQYSQSAALAAMRARVPFLPADSARWVGEMEEIASTFGDVGVPSGFHEGAAEIFRILEKTPYASETRADMDRERTLEDALEVFVRELPKET